MTASPSDNTNGATAAVTASATTANAVSVLAIQRWDESFRRSSIGVDDFLAEVGIAPDTDPTVKVPMAHVASVLDRLALSTNKPHIGIDLALSMPPGVLGPFDYRWSASATLLEAMLRSVGRFRKFTESIQYELHCDGADANASIVQRNREVPPVIMEHFLAGLVCRMRHVADVRVQFSAVRFSHGSNTPTTRLDEFFGTQVEMNAPVTELVFPAALLQRKLLTADAALLKLLRDHPQSNRSLKIDAGAGGGSGTGSGTAAEPPSDPFLDQVREAVSQSLMGVDGGELVKKIAERLRMSSRSLQRKLGERDTSLSDVVDEVRRDLAMKLVMQPGMLIADIAIQLGFGNVSTVFRAFRRWTGMSPRDYLKQLRAVP